MTRNEILNLVFNDAEYKQIASRRDANGDLYSEFCLYICEMPEKKLKELFDKKYLKFHCISVLMHSSDFRDKYIKFDKSIVQRNGSGQFLKERSIYNEEGYSISAWEIYEIPDTDVYDYDIDHQFKRLEIALQNENDYDKMLFLAATTGITLSNGEVKKYRSLLHLSRESGIPYKSILTSINNIKQRVSKQI